MKGKQLQLAMDTIQNIMAIETLIKSKIPTDKVNGKPLGDKCYCVSIDASIKGVAIISMKVNNKDKQVQQVVGL